MWFRGEYVLHKKSCEIVYSNLTNFLIIFFVKFIRVYTHLYEIFVYFMSVIFECFSDIYLIVHILKFFN